MLGHVVHEPGERHRVPDPEPIGVRAQLRLPVAVPDDGERRPGQRGDRVDRQLDPLVRHQPAEHDHARLRAARPGRGVHRQHRRVQPGVDDPDPVGVDADRDQVGPGGGGDGQVAAAPVDPRRQPGLQPPADPAEGAAEDRGPLLPVQVVGDVDDQRPGEQRRPERHPVLHVQHHVVPAPPPGQGQRRPRVDGEPAAAAHVRHPVDGLLRHGAGVAGAPHGHLVPERRQAAGHPLAEALGPAALGMARITPVEEQYAQPVLHPPRRPLSALEAAA